VATRSELVIRAVSLAEGTTHPLQKEVAIGATAPTDNRRRVGWWLDGRSINGALLRRTRWRRSCGRDEWDERATRSTLGDRKPAQL